MDIDTEFQTANKIWNECNDLKTIKKTDNKYRKVLDFKKEWGAKSTENKILYFQSKYNDFVTKYSIPVRYMVAYHEYDEKVFYNFLNKMKNGYNSRDDWIKLQADYIQMLYNSYNPKSSKSQDIWVKAYESIKSEMDTFKSDYDKAKEKAELKTLELLTYQKMLLKTIFIQKKVVDEVVIIDEDNSSVF